MRQRTYREPINYICLVLPESDDGEAFINLTFHALQPPVKRYDHVTSADQLYYILCQTEDLVKLGDVVITYLQLTPAMQAVLDLFATKFNLMEPDL